MKDATIMDKPEKHLGSVSEDIDHVLDLVERSYNIQFGTNELEHIRTFRQLTDLVISKLKLENKDDCTDQQAFYKLRAAIEKVKNIEKPASILPSTQLTELFPRKTRKREIKEIEEILGLKLEALMPRQIVGNSLTIIFLLSVIGLFFKWPIGLTGLATSIAGFRISEATGKEFKDTTLRELTDRMTQSNYAKSRRQLGTMNANEIHAKIEKLFVENLGLEENSIARDTVIL